MTNPKNIIGPQIERLRRKRGMTQQQFTAHCTRLGLTLTRATLSKIEGRLRRVKDSEVLVLAKALKVDLRELFRGASR